MTEREFVTRVYTTYDLPAAEVCLEDDGDVAFDWCLEAGRVLSVSISAKGKLGWAGLFDGESAHACEWNDELDKIFKLFEVHS